MTTTTTTTDKNFSFISIDSTTKSMMNKTIIGNNSETLFQLIAKLLNGTELYKHQVADLMEPEKYSITSVHIVIWTFTILTYLLAIPIIVRMFLTRSYLNPIEYFSAHIVFCAFVAWIPALILLLHQWFDVFTLRLCRFHYVILSTNETVPICFVFYMIIERFLYAHPSYKHYFSSFLSNKIYLHLLTIGTWISTMFIYMLASPFYERNSKLVYSLQTTKYCLYNYSKLHLLATARSIIYFLLFFPSLILIGFVLRYFFLLRGTNQIPPIEKLWTIRVTALISILVFYDVYLYYLEHIVESFRSFLLASLLRASFYLVQLFIISCTEPYWIELILERCTCLRCLFNIQRRSTNHLASKPLETEFHTVSHGSSIGNYSLVDDTIDDEFDRALHEPEPTLRVIS